MDAEKGFKRAQILLTIVGIAFRIALVIAVLSLFLVYVCNMGAWRFMGVLIVVICQKALMSSVLLAIALRLVVEPVWFNAEKKLFIHFAQDSVGCVDEHERYECDYSVRYMKKITMCEVSASIVAALVALFSHDSLMASFGMPFADIFTLLIVWLGSRVLFICIFHVSAGDLKKEDSDLFDKNMDAHSKARSGNYI